MSLPDGFSPAEHFQDTVKKIYNRDVREWFSDVDDDELDINTARSSLKTACTHLEGDSIILTHARMMLFENTIRGRNAITDVGTTDRAPHVLRRGHPKVLLFFMEDVADLAVGYAPVRGEISFRLMDETSESISQAKAQTIAQRIKSNFSVGSGYIWRKGKTMVSYSDWEKGYQLQLLCRSKSDGKELIQNILDVQGHTPDWEFLNASENEAPGQAYPALPPTERILGETRRLPRRRPIADVRFRYANLFLPGRPAPVNLVDRTGTYTAPLVS